MKELLNRLEEAEMRADKAEEAWGVNPESEELEAKFDEAYAEEYKIKETIAKMLYDITDGAIDRQTANAMINTKRDELKAIVKKVA